MSDLDDKLETCSLCNGKGYASVSSNGRGAIKVKICGFDFWRPKCPKCKGLKKINWIENVFGVKDEEENHWSGTSSTGPR